MRRAEAIKKFWVRACVGAMLLSVPPALANEPIAKPFDPLVATSQEKLLKNLRSLWKVLKEVPRDIYRCSGLLSDDGWTGPTIRKHPKLAEVLDSLFKYRLKEKKNFEYLCFLNNHGDFKGIADINYGVCAGVTAMNWIATYLSLYDFTGKTFPTFHPEMKLPEGHTVASFKKLLKKSETTWKKSLAEDPYASTKIVLDDDDRQILTFYAPFIDRLFRERKPTVIPFFTDMNAFSNHPSVKAYLEKLAIETWFDVNVSLSSIIEILAIGGRSGKTMRQSEVAHLDRQIGAYLKHKMQPIVFINLPSFAGQKKRIHVLRVISSKWKTNGDEYLVTVVDPNYPPGGNIHDIEFKGVVSKPNDVQVVYHPYESLQTDPDSGVIRSLTDVEVAPFFDHLSVRTLEAWRHFLAEDGEDALSRLAATVKDKKPKPKARPKPKLPKESE